jgi:anhydro-N-acetylmuramic acid kinase
MRVIGLMSGTSGDGIDVALCDITGAPPTLSASIIEAWSIPYEENFRQQIFHACEKGNAQDICRLNAEIGEGFAKAITDHIDLSTVDLIGSHGQTIWHDVTQQGTVTSTLQIGAPAIIAERTGVTTISNFRERDIAAGGQGAPLTAYVDWLLLRDPVGWRAVQNIGGMGNVTFVPPLDDQTSPLIAFDTGPGNALIDGAMLILQNKPYDADGALAGSGKIHHKWLKQLLSHSYFQQPPPRTTGRETFGTDYARELVQRGKLLRLPDADIIATITALTAHSIADAYRQYAPSMPQSVILGGGGSHNQTLISMLGELLPIPVLTHEDIGLDSDFKEALVFAVLAYETWHNRVGCLPSQTGATHATVLGQITPSTNYAELLKRTWL